MEHGGRNSAVGRDEDEHGRHVGVDHAGTLADAADLAYLSACSEADGDLFAFCIFSCIVILSPLESRSSVKQFKLPLKTVYVGLVINHNKLRVRHLCKQTYIFCCKFKRQVIDKSVTNLSFVCIAFLL